jgi:hypothetical protein
MLTKGKYILTALGESVVVGAPEVDGKGAVWTAGEDTYSVIFFSSVWGLLSTARSSRCLQPARTDWYDCCKKAVQLFKYQVDSLEAD